MFPAFAAVGGGAELPPLPAAAGAIAIVGAPAPDCGVCGAGGGALLVGAGAGAGGLAAGIALFVPAVGVFATGITPAVVCVASPAELLICVSGG